MSDKLINEENICVRCGACCATYRVSFYSAEADILSLPDELIDTLSTVFSCMTGTNQKIPRCAALQGQIGTEARCEIYAKRPSPCHEVQIGDERCQQARAKHGLGAL